MKRSTMTIATIIAIIVISVGTYWWWTAQPTNIVETAQTAGSLSMLLTALEAAGLVDALKGAGPFTIFAPTDAAVIKSLRFGPPPFST